MIPYVNKKNTHFLSVSDFSGGVDLSNQASLINENQLTNVNNMWFKNGVLKTRPKLKCSFQEGSIFKTKPSVSIDEMNTVIIDSKVYKLETVRENNLLHLSLVGEDRITLGSIELSESASFLAVLYKGNIFVYVNDNENRIYRIDKIAEGQYSQPKAISDEDIYTPLVLINCWSCFNDSGKLNAMLVKGATQYEGFNLLGSRYRIQFSQYDAKDYIEVNPGDASSRISYMEYGLPFTTSACQGNIYLEYTCIEGVTHRHMVACPKGKTPTVETEEGKNNADDSLYLHAFVKGDVCHISLNSDGNASNYQPETISVDKYINGNMMVNAPKMNSQENWEKVTAMTQAVWYGNTSLGVNGGSRLFLGGSTKEDALLLWSDFENPLYFPENNYAYVGDKAQNITAFGRQGSSLIIFKEKEIYATQYNQGELEGLEDENVIDITTRAAYFPMVLVHPSIGCDCPQSIQLLRNRLVFLNSSGNVYTLTEQNQYSERNVYEISGTIASVLNDDLKNAVSADWNGLYLLFVKNTAFVMDYNTYGYVNISSCTKENTANSRIPWYIWHLPESVCAAAVYGNDLKVWLTDENNGSVLLSVGAFTEDALKDEFLSLKDEKTESEVHSLMETKHFDFSEPHKLKTIEKVWLETIKSSPVTVTFITEEKIPDIHQLYLNSLVPNNRYVKTLGIRLESQGDVALSALTIAYRRK